MSSLLRASRLKALVAALLSAIFLQALPMRAYADVRVSGETEALKIEASNASLEEVLAALGRSCGLQYRYPADFSRSVSGTYEGSLRQVLSRLLQGTNFVLESSASGTKVVIYDLHSAPGGSINLVRPAPVVTPPRPPPEWGPIPGRSGFPPPRVPDLARSARARRHPIGR
jgi:hypothetical protein